MSKMKAGATETVRRLVCNCSELEGKMCAASAG